MSEELVTVEIRRAPVNPEVVFVDQKHQLDEMVARLSKSTGPVALDAERASGFKYFQRAYLVQLTRLDCPIYLIDPIGLVAADPKAFDSLGQLLAKEEWILHAATQDIPCLAELGLRPGAIFDTEHAGRLLGEARVGLGALCEQWLSLGLAKEHSAVDWSTRPLNADWLNYAALDVDVLLELREAAVTALENAGKTEWARQEFEKLATFEAKGPKPDKWRSMSGLHEVKDQRSLAIARALWVARDALGMKLDVSPGRLVPDSAIVAAAKDKPKSRSALAGMKTFNGRASRTYLDTWWNAVSEGLETIKLPDLRPPLVGIPSHRNWENRFPEAHARLLASRPALVEIAEANNVPIENLLQPDLLRLICWQPPTDITGETVAAFLADGGARKWQSELVSGILSETLLALPKEPEAPKA